MSPELRLVAACCRWPDDDARKQAIVSAAAGVEDWGQAVALGEAHRVEGFVAQGLAAARVRVPHGIRDSLDRRREEVRTLALRQAGKTLQLSNVLAAEGIEHRLFKGVPLGVTVYGTPTLKRSWDIDLLVLPEQAVASAALLRDLGYHAQPPVRDFNRVEFERWAVATKELILESPDGSVVELHWRLSDHPLLLKGLDARTPGCEVEILGGHRVPTFSPAANLAYLAVHGAFHGWSRLKWLADYAALVRALKPDRGLMEEARRFETGRAIDQAMALSQIYFGTFLGTSGTDRPADHATGQLVALASRVIDARSPHRDIEVDPAAQKLIRKAQWRLHPGRRYRLLLALRWVRGSEDRKQIALPRGLAWAYWGLRPFTAAARVVRRRLAR